MSKEKVTKTTKGFRVQESDNSKAIKAKTKASKAEDRIEAKLDLIIRHLGIQ